MQHIQINIRSTHSISQHVMQQ